MGLAQNSIPELWGQRVHDDAHILKQSTVDQLERSLKAQEDSTSNQIAILIIQSLNGEVLENYSMSVVEKWKLGEKSKDNGVLLLIAVDDHKMRIEVGHGLEGVLTDAMCNRIIRNEIAPAFRRNDYDAGVTDGISAIVRTIGGEYKAESASDNVPWTLIVIVAIIFFVGVLVASFVKEFRSDGNSIPSGKKFATKPGSKKKHLSDAVLLSGLFNTGGKSSSSGSGLSLGNFIGKGGSFGGGGSSGSW
ncbi:methanol dehydrogenase [Cytophagales bacterium WSM2-2]|nr:methanol dehydrogenase [Cytophagales bacterium WSM2-2]